MMTGGGIIAVAFIALAWLRNRPEDMGLLPYGSSGVSQHSFSGLQALRTRAFWFIAMAEGLAAVEVLTLTDLAIASGFSGRVSAFAVTILGLTSFLFLPVGGLVGDRLSKSAALAAFTVIQLVGWVVLYFSGITAALYLSAVFLGMSKGGRTPISIAILADYLGTGSLPVILGLFGLFSGVIAYGAIPMAGFLYDIQGQGGFAGFLVGTGMILIAVLLFWKASPPPLPASAQVMPSDP